MGLPQLALWMRNEVEFTIHLVIVAPYPSRTLSEAIPNPVFGPCNGPVFFSGLRAPESCRSRLGPGLTLGFVFCRRKTTVLTGCIHLPGRTSCTAKYGKPGIFQKSSPDDAQ
jgi:hypothetical protein